MLKQFLQAPPETGPIDGYTSELSRTLRPHVSSERADEIISEAQAHLLDQADAIARTENLSRQEAEARAIAVFTPAAHFAREMAQSVYEGGQSKVWRRGGAMAAAALFVFLFGMLYFGTWGEMFIIWTLLLALPLIAAFAYHARRAQTRRFAFWGIMATTATLLYTGFFFLDGAPTDEAWTQGSRARIQSAYDDWHGDTVRREKEVRLLQTGLQAFQGKSRVVPAELHGENHTYIVPDGFGKHVGFYPFRITVPETVATLDEARSRWQTDGPRWLRGTRQVLNSDRHYEEPLRVALQQTGWAKTAPWYAGTMGGFSAFLVVCDAAFAGLGRAVYTKRRTKRKTRRA